LADPLAALAERLRKAAAPWEPAGNDTHYLALAREALTFVREQRPKIVCLCGSTRFMDAFFDEGWRLTLEGVIVLSVGVWRQGPPDHGGEWIGEATKRALDDRDSRAEQRGRSAHLASRIR
jgi:hypothetical protein